jgi:hypothetical protein
VEIFRRNFLASMVPVIVNAVLNEHQLVIDIVAFVSKGDFHRSRLGEKQRGKILAGWVTRKMRTIAQYSIRDPNGSDVQMISEEPMGRTSTSTFMRGPASTKGSLRASSTLGLTAQAQLNSMHLSHRASMQELSAQQSYPPGMAEMPAQSHQSYGNYPPQQSVPELENRTQSLSLDPNHPSFDNGDRSERTPTEPRRDFLPNLQHNPMMDYSPIEATGVFDSPVDGPANGSHPQQYQPQQYQPQQYQQQQQYPHQQDDPIPSILRVGSAKLDEPMQYQPMQFQPYQPVTHAQQQGHDQENLTRQYSSEDDTDWRGGGGGGLRVANRDSTASNDSWTRDALAQMNFAGNAGQAK